MSRLIETIRCEDGRLNNLAYHEQRMRRGMKAVFGMDHPVDLNLMLAQFPIPPAGLHKCRVVYDNKSQQAEFTPYEPRLVQFLRIIRDDRIEYPHKFVDRSRLEKNFANRMACDDILMIRNEMVTDSFQANIVFRKGTEWFTPSSCLLPGTMRQSLLDRGLISEEEISVNDIAFFDSFKLINAMLCFDFPELPVRNILE